MKVYVVNMSTGSYEDYWVKLIDIYSDPLKAEAVRAQIELQSGETALGECPIEDESDEALKLLSDTMYKKYSDWYWERDARQDFNWCKVVEYELKQ